MDNFLMCAFFFLLRLYVKYQIISVSHDCFFLFTRRYADRLKGWPAFFGSITGIGILTAVIGDVAAHFGCISLIKDSVTAITIVALGTSVPGY